MKTKGLGLGRAVLQNNANTLFFTTKCFFVDVDANWKESVLTRAEAMEAYGFEEGEGAFNFWVHNPSGNLYDPPSKEDDEFEAEKKLQLFERFVELQRLPEFKHCLITQGSETRIVSLEVDDHDEIQRMNQQQLRSYGHFGSGFAASLPTYQATWLEGNLVGKDDNFWNLKFWHTHTLKLGDVGGRGQCCPHLWVNVEGSRITSEADYRLIARCAVKAILSFHVKMESFFGRDPYHRGLKKYPGDPNKITFVKSFKTVGCACEPAPF